MAASCAGFAYPSFDDRSGRSSPEAGAAFGAFRKRHSPISADPTQPLSLKLSLCRLDQAQIRFEPLRLADLDPPEIGMQRIEEIIDFGGNDHAWDGKHCAATFSSPFRSNGPELLAGRDIPPVRGKILDLYPVYCYGLRKPDFDHDIASPKRFILDQHFEHGQGLARRGINERNAFTIPAAAVESGSVSGKRRFSESRGG